jgi:hypothetical protein
LSALDVYVRVPREAELADVLIIDLFEWAETLFVVGASVAHPISGIVVCVQQPRIVDAGRRNRLA